MSQNNMHELGYGYKFFLNQITLYGVVMSIMNNKTEGRLYCYLLKKNGELNYTSLQYITILPIEKQLEEFDEYYFKLIQPPEHLKQYISEKQIKTEI